jgi:hypothetical protein
VPREEIDDRYLDSPYYLSPTNQSDRKPLRSFAMPSARRRWWGLAGWFSADANMSR